MPKIGGRSRSRPLIAASAAALLTVAGWSAWRSVAAPVPARGPVVMSSPLAARPAPPGGGPTADQEDERATGPSAAPHRNAGVQSVPPARQVGPKTVHRSVVSHSSPSPTPPRVPSEPRSGPNAAYKSARSPDASERDRQQTSARGSSTTAGQVAGGGAAQNGGIAGGGANRPADPSAGVTGDVAPTAGLPRVPEAVAPQILPPRVITAAGTTYPVDGFRLTVRHQDLGAALVVEGAEGTVGVRALVQANGTVAKVEIMSSSGSTALDQAAEQAVHRWLFAPATRDGVPIDAYVTFKIRYVVR